jgi:hypothetical protein
MLRVPFLETGPIEAAMSLSLPAGPAPQRPPTGLHRTQSAKQNRKFCRSSLQTFRLYLDRYS